MVNSYAKINLFLKILDKRPDGFHNLMSLFQRIELRDELSFEPKEKGIFIESSDQGLPTDPSNLVYRAAELLLKQLSRGKGVKISIRKNIPIGGGLGGGSSNAAATLVKLNELWELNYSAGELAKMGASLGSDVPFFCHQVSSAWVSGKGEMIEPTAISSDYWILLVFPSFSIMTVDAYQLWDLNKRDKNGLTNPENRNKISSFQTSFHFFDRLENDFEVVLFDKYPLLKKIQHYLYQEKAKKVLVSGSGSTLFAVFLSEKNAREAGENIIKAFPSLAIHVTRPV